MLFPLQTSAIITIECARDVIQQTVIQARIDLHVKSRLKQSLVYSRACILLQYVELPVSDSKSVKKNRRFCRKKFSCFLKISKVKKDVFRLI